MAISKELREKGIEIRKKILLEALEKGWNCCGDKEKCWECRGIPNYLFSARRDDE